MESKPLLTFIAVGLAWFLLGKEVGRWGFRDTITRPKGATWLAIILVLFAMSQAKDLALESRNMLGYIAIIFPVAVIVFRVRQYGTWNIFGLDMRKICYIRDIATQRLARGGSLQLMAELGKILRDEDDWRVRRCILNALAARPSVMSLHYLDEGLEDSNPPVQIEAAKGIGYSALVLFQRQQIDSTKLKGMISRLEQLLQNPNLDSKVRYQLERTQRLITSISN